MAVGKAEGGAVGCGPDDAARVDGQVASRLEYLHHTEYVGGLGLQFPGGTAQDWAGGAGALGRSRSWTGFLFERVIGGVRAMFRVSPSL